jgi:uncharacterized paraquat-inducible protein A
MGHYIGFIKCENCNLWITNDEDSKFKRHKVKCSKCNFKVSFESMDEGTDCTCFNCQIKMENVR